MTAEKKYHATTNKHDGRQEMHYFKTMITQKNALYNYVS